jgi:uncharacterized protein (DUF2249 family)
MGQHLSLHPLLLEDILNTIDSGQKSKIINDHPLYCGENASVYLPEK